MMTMTLIGLIIVGGIMVVSLSAATLPTLSDERSGLIPAHLVAFARAIAIAEGYYRSDGVTVNVGAIPVTANNPGNLKNGDVGFGTIHDITIYQSASDGFRALYDQLLAIGAGASGYYTPSMSLDAMGLVWSGGDANWSRNVAHILGISTDSAIAPWVTA